MIATYSDSTFTSRSTFGAAELKSILVEPFLVVGVSLFWLVTLPFAALSLLAVKIWDSFALTSLRRSRTNPLILRRGQASENASAPVHGAAVKRA